jgi:hypothetical protein
MNTNYKIMVAGVLLFILGIYLMLNRDYNYFLSNIHPDLGIVGFLVPPSAGLVITGVGIMLEFARRKYEVQE